MSVDREKVEQMIRNSQGIPSNPEIAAKIAQDTTPLVSEPSSFMQPSAQEQGLNEEPASVDFFGGLAADMDNEVNSYAEPVGKHQVDELP